MEETHDRLKEYYDGYHFCEDNMQDIYNPYSIINALSQSKLRNYWASSGATTLLPKFVNDIEIELETFEGCYIDRDTLEMSDVTGGGAALFLYQSGYLTIKGYDDGLYILGFPNEEVKKALYNMVVPALTLKDISQIVTVQALLTKPIAEHDRMMPWRTKCHCSAKH